MEKIVKLQLALFFNNLILRPDSLMNGINSSMGNLFDAMPQILPIPADAPADIPRVQMRSENGKYNCNISCSRVDFILNGDFTDEASWPDLTRDFMAKVKLFSSKVFDDSKINRFGLIGNFFIPDKSSSTSMTKKYLKVDLNTAEEINLRFNKRSSSHGFQLNNITSVNTAIFELNGKIDKGIFIELDVNNIPTEDSVKSDNLLQLIEKQIPSFSPDKVKGLVK
ncbi:hypothetical protein Q4574_13140 [Aliiglaciecola sp. 3_MG-2023]|uniref:hypothetical protein n=1 Tax=Aliiglaciecola sp. 3_MG-2023 TaxID=3062644 RepID=UPI0026E4173F|nr:hypothetical protein [Aliiglaciecola sp. 3_MG-2023]MDO6694232.1 hypothetical protein [Aliiglaciecola sp. 3_MG-2023]